MRIFLFSVLRYKFTIRIINGQIIVIVLLVDVIYADLAQYVFQFAFLAYLLSILCGKFPFVYIHMFFYKFLYFSYTFIGSHCTIICR